METTLARLSIQCTAPTGERGTYLTYTDGALASPVMPDMYALSLWCARNGWRWRDGFDPMNPVVVYYRT
jgi:hypothetical protein